MGKRMLRVPNVYNNLLPRVTLQLPSIKVQIFIRKLRFPAHLFSSNNQTLGPTIFWTLAMCNVDDISLVQQCRWLENYFSSKGITDSCLRRPMEASGIVREAESELLKQDELLTLMEARSHQSLKHIIKIKCWLHVWDNALDKDCSSTIQLQLKSDLTCAKHLIMRMSSLSTILYLSAV